MQPGVIINRNELCTALRTLGAKQLSDVVKVPDNFELSEDVVQEMLLKSFFVVDEEGNPGWNDFVHMVLWTAVNAESELRINGRYGTSCRLFFQGDTMILLTFEAGKDGYILYFIPVIPQAIGGLASALDWLEAPMGELHLAADGAAPSDGDKTDEVLLDIRGWLFGKPDYQAKLTYGAGVHTFEWRSADGDSGSKSVGFLEMVQQMIPWVVKAHGRSIQEKGFSNDEL
jgi:hypothetical protein